MIVYGSGISDGNRHNNENLPIVLAGRGGGWIRPGRHIQYSGDTPLNNLFATMLNQAGATTSSFNDSTGTLPFLS
jgi:acetyl esterase/lipase